MNRGCRLAVLAVGLAGLSLAVLPMAAGAAQNGTADPAIDLEVDISPWIETNASHVTVYTETSHDIDVMATKQSAFVKEVTDNSSLVSTAPFVATVDDGKLVTHRPGETVLRACFEHEGTVYRRQTVVTVADERPPDPEPPAWVNPEFTQGLYPVDRGQIAAITITVGADRDAVALTLGDRDDQSWELGLVIDTSAHDGGDLTLRVDTAAVGGGGLPPGTPYDPAAYLSVPEPGATVRAVYIDAEGMGFRNLHEGGMVPATDTWSFTLPAMTYDLVLGTAYNDTGATAAHEISMTDRVDLAALEVRQTEDPRTNVSEPIAAPAEPVDLHALVRPPGDRLWAAHRLLVRAVGLDYCTITG